ncbi:hypothetical protein NDU88_001017 [Pleurodeles waltl]|uniref:Uncharacterized protein n=1 Tax=Pleurodeles waltl TaxID=8319 RepID=A0AAV7VXV0_PLEWA|nr:hypothetical protein NDU88_001017 [Pleurodeles waltl]
MCRFLTHKRERALFLLQFGQRASLLLSRKRAMRRSRWAPWVREGFALIYRAQQCCVEIRSHGVQGAACGLASLATATAGVARHFYSRVASVFQPRCRWSIDFSRKASDALFISHEEGGASKVSPHAVFAWISSSFLPTSPFKGPGTGQDTTC